jgi:hypothetical protein
MGLGSFGIPALHARREDLSDRRSLTAKLAKKNHIHDFMIVPRAGLRQPLVR